jgi:hypothetical protein
MRAQKVGAVLIRPIATTILAALCAASSLAQPVKVEHVGIIDISGADCRRVTDSSFITRLCFFRSRGEVLATLNGKNYLYCMVSQAQFREWVSATSKGAYFNQEIKGRHDC